MVLMRFPGSNSKTRSTIIIGNRCFKCSFTSSKVMVIETRLRNVIHNAESRFLVYRSSLTAPQHHAQGTREKAATGDRIPGIRDQADNPEANFLGHLEGLTFVMKLKSVIPLGGFQGSTEKDDPIIREMMGDHLKQRAWV